MTHTVRTPGRVAGVLVLAGALAAVLAACGGQHQAGSARTGGKPKIVPSAEAGAGQVPASDAPGGLNGDNTGGGNGQQSWPSNSPRPTRTASPAPTGPQIVYFKLTQQPKCGGVVNGKHTDPVPAIVAWKATGGVTAMALSVDNPELVGGYRTYQGAEGSETFTFSCAPPAGTSETHTYTMNTVGGGASRRAQFSVTVKSLPQS
jgi:hypothetical protein